MTTRQRRTAEQWKSVINQQEVSGLNAAEFCQQKNLDLKYFCKRKRMLEIPKTTKQQTSTFITLQRNSPLSIDSSQSMVLHYNQNTHLQLSTEIDPGWLAQLMKSLA